MIHKIYPAISIARADKLKDEAKAIAEENNLKGLVLVKTRMGDDGLETVVEPVTKLPSQYQREQARREGINLNGIMTDVYDEIENH